MTFFFIHFVSFRTIPFPSLKQNKGTKKSKMNKRRKKNSRLEVSDFAKNIQCDSALLKKNYFCSILSSVRIFDLAFQEPTLLSNKQNFK